MLEKLTIEEKQELKASFQRLNSVTEKLDFWMEKFQKPYFFNSFSDHQTISDFLINPQSKEEAIEINERCLEEIKLYGFNIPVLNINDLLDRFHKHFQEAKNKAAILDNQRKAVLKEVSVREIACNDIMKKVENDFWIIGFKQSYLIQQDLDLSKGTYETYNLVNLNNGFCVGEFLRELDLIEIDLKNNRESSTRARTSVRQQILILESLDILQLLEKKLAAESEKGIFLSKNLTTLLATLLNAGDKSVKDALANINKTKYIKTIKNYDFLIGLFSQVGLLETNKVAKNQQDKLKIKESIR